jgi:aspartyl protease family protein
MRRLISAGSKMLRSIFPMVLVVALASFVGSGFVTGRIPLSRLTQAVMAFLPSHGSAPSPDASAAVAATEVPARSRIAGNGEVDLVANRAGNYETEVEINGQSIRMIVDTGASFVSLSNEDANLLGIHPSPSDFRYRTMTANGTGVAAKVHLNSLRLGPMEVYDVDAFVMGPHMLATSLLGMSVLKRLGSVQLSGDTLILRQ